MYGGGNVGLMGIVADAVLRAGGEVQGVIPGHPNFNFPEVFGRRGVEGVRVHEPRRTEHDAALEHHRQMRNEGRHSR